MALILENYLEQQDWNIGQV